MTTDRSTLPVLWQFRMSHYNEKVRWALDYKGIRHVRHSLVPGLHIPRVLLLTRQKQVPVLVLDGRTIVGSQTIIDAIERAHPEPVLYPVDALERQRALELCGVFDDELGPALRLAFFHAVLGDSAYATAMFAHGCSPVTRALYRLSFPAVRAVMQSDMGINDRSAAEAREHSEVMFSRIEKQVGPSGYLVGNTFTIADLTVAALLSPLVQPPEFPYAFPPMPAAGVRLRDALGHHLVNDWCRAIYAKHRGRSVEVD